ncbi:hypothetical protein WKK05_29315 [Nostoc sp. UHCC 0302]
MNFLDKIALTGLSLGLLFFILGFSLSLVITSGFINETARLLISAGGFLFISSVITGLFAAIINIWKN